MPAGVVHRSELLALVICRMVNLSLEHGNSDGRASPMYGLGMLAGPHFGNYKAGFRFGRLGYDLVEKRGLNRFQARTYMTLESRHAMDETCPGRPRLLRRAFDAANRIGDLTYAAYCCDHLNTNLLAAGDPLAEVQGEAEQGLEFPSNIRFGLVIDTIIAQLGLIRTLRGLTAKFGSFDEGRSTRVGSSAICRVIPLLALPECWYWIRKIQARFLAGDYAAAVRPH